MVEAGERDGTGRLNSRGQQISLLSGFWRDVGYLHDSMFFPRSFYIYSRADRFIPMHYILARNGEKLTLLSDS